MNVQHILSIKGKGVVTIKPEQTVKYAIMQMEKHNIGSLVVLDDAKQMVGIVTERRIIRQAPQVADILSRRVDEVMQTEIITVTPEDDLNALAHAMTEHRVRHLPICDQDQLMGIISIGDVLKAQRDLYHGEASTLEMQIMADDLMMG